VFEHVDLPVLEHELIALRREFHRYPKIDWSEFRTAARIVWELEKLDFTVEYGPALHTTENAECTRVGCHGALLAAG